MVQVTYQGGGMDGVTSNAASEATLQLLLKALGSGGGGGAASDLANKAQKAGMLGTKANTKATKGQTEATGDQTKATNKSTKGDMRKRNKPKIESEKKNKASQ